MNAVVVGGGGAVERGERNGGGGRWEERGWKGRIGSNDLGFGWVKLFYCI